MPGKTGYVKSVSPATITKYPHRLTHLYPQGGWRGRQKGSKLKVMLNLSIPQILFFGGGFLACLAPIWLQLRGLNLTVAILSDSQNRECASLSTLINRLIN